MRIDGCGLALRMHASAVDKDDGGTMALTDSAERTALEYSERWAMGTDNGLCGPETCRKFMARKYDYNVLAEAINCETALGIRTYCKAATTFGGERKTEPNIESLCLGLDFRNLPADVRGLRLGRGVGI